MEGIDISTLNIKYNDTIILTVDTDSIDIDTVYECIKCFQQNFNNDIIVKIKGINIEVGGNRC